MKIEGDVDATQYPSWVIQAPLNPCISEQDSIQLGTTVESKKAVRLHPAGHILGSAYLEFRITQGSRRKTVIFSGDLGAPYAPLLPSPKASSGADVVVLESTYGDRNRENRRNRRLTLRKP